MTGKDRIIRVRVRAGARVESVERVADDQFRIAVKERAEQGRANERVRVLLAVYCKVPIQTVRIVRGHRTPNKYIAIKGHAG